MSTVTIGQTYHVRDVATGQTINLTEIPGVEPDKFGIRFTFNANTEDSRTVEVTFGEADGIAECIRKITTSRKAIEDMKADEEQQATVATTRLRTSQFPDDK